MTLVILAAGMGSRYGGMKQIDPITEDGNFIIDFSIYDAVKAGFNKVVFIIKEEHLADFRDTVGSRISDHIDVEYAFQRLDAIPDWYIADKDRVKPWGTTQALLCAAKYLNEPFAVINSDDFYGREAFDILARHLRNNADGDKAQFCMVGYKLKNTLTKHGAVNRGVCNVDGSGYLRSITETKEISLSNDCDHALCSRGKLSLDTTVSMNCWGFTPRLVPYLQEVFYSFLKNVKDPVRDESYLTDVIDIMIKRDECDVTVYDTDATWLGVTYSEDKPYVVEEIKHLIALGEYPEHLWK